MIAVRIAAEPDVRNALRGHLMQSAVVNTFPTDKGDKSIDYFHPDIVASEFLDFDFVSFCMIHRSSFYAQNVKRIKDKPVHRFQNSTHFAEMLLAEKRGHVTVEVSDPSIREAPSREVLLNTVLHQQFFMIDASDLISEVSSPDGKSLGFVCLCGLSCP